MVYNMRREIVWRYFFGVICALSCYSPLWAQLTLKPRNLHAVLHIRARDKNLDEPMARIIIDQVKFDGPTQISALIRQKAVWTLTHRDFGNNSVRIRLARETRRRVARSRLFRSGSHRETGTPATRLAYDHARSNDRAHRRRRTVSPG